jgi:hypothetical protein
VLQVRLAATGESVSRGDCNGLRLGGLSGSSIIKKSPRQRGSTVFDPEAQTQRELTEVRQHSAAEFVLILQFAGLSFVI